jgi:hypothetical protein
MFYIKVILGLILFVLVTVLFVQNHETMITAVHFKLNIPYVINLQSADITLYIILPLCFLLGALIMWLLCLKEHFRLKGKINSLTSASKEKEKELNSFRNLPLTSDDVSSGHSTANINEE